MKRDITIHKEIEKELAKRSHFCQKTIKKLKAKQEELEQKRDQMPKGIQVSDVEGDQNISV